MEKDDLLKLAKGIMQAASNAGYTKTNALKREKLHKNFEVSDNFNVKIQEDKVKIHYSMLVVGKNFSEDHLKSNIEKIFADIVKFLKDRVKECCGENVTFKELDKGCSVESVLQININKQIRNYVKVYEVKKLNKFVYDED